MAAARNPLVVHFGGKLRACHSRIGISQEELGFRTSLHRTEAGLLERGLRESRLNTEEGFTPPGPGDVPVE